MTVLANDPPFDVRDVRPWLIALNDAISNTALTSSQLGNRVLAAPNGAPGTPTWRLLVEADIPNLSASKITTGTLANARINFAAPSAIGSTTPAAGTFTNVQAQSSFGLSGIVLNFAANYPMGANDTILINNYGIGAGTASLPAASNGRFVMIKNISINSLTINRVGADTINAPGTTTTVATSFNIASGTWVICVANSGIWYCIN